MESELNSATTDMQATFLNALAHDGAISEQPMSIETLGRVYGHLQKQVQDSLLRQESLIGEVQVGK